MALETHLSNLFSLKIVASVWFRLAVIVPNLLINCDVELDIHSGSVARSFVIRGTTDSIFTQNHLYQWCTR